MSNLPHFLTDPENPKSQEFRADCMAWELYTKKSAKEREAFIAGQPGLNTGEFRERIRRVEAWWLLTHCTHFQIEQMIAELAPVDMKEVRSHLELMRLEMKAVRQRKYKTVKGKCNA